MSDALTREQVELKLSRIADGEPFNVPQILAHDAALRARCEAAEQQWRKTNAQYEQTAKAVTRLTTQLAQMMQERAQLERQKEHALGSWSIANDVAFQRLQMIDALKSQLTSAQATSTRLREALSKFLSLVSESRGVEGFHLNGEIAEWGEFEFIELAQQAIASSEGKEGG